MDPDANLKMQREIAKRIHTEIDRGERPDEVDVDRLASLVLALDEWIARGGFLPARWRRES